MKTRSKGNLLGARREKVSDEIHPEPDSNPTKREPIDHKSKAFEGAENLACTGATDDAEGDADDAHDMPSSTSHIGL